MGKRMRPHTLATPKPLIPIAGKPIVQRLVEDIAKVCSDSIENIGFVIAKSFGQKIEASLKEIASQIGSNAHIFYQEEALGTAHAILCAKDILFGNTVVAFADTLFKADFKLDSSKDSIIWVKQVKEPSAFGVVHLNSNKEVTAFIEKPETFISDLAIIGIYYFKDGEYLKSELQYLLDNNIKEKGEFQLTNALENMKKGTKFVSKEVVEWLDCGNKNATVYSNKRYLEFIKDQKLIADSVVIDNSVIIPPCYIGEGVVLKNSVVGPHVSVGDNSFLENSIVKNAIIQTNSKIGNTNIANSMIGNFVTFESPSQECSIGDYNTIK